MEILKRTLCIISTAILVLTVFSACSHNNAEIENVNNEIQLTTDNASQYLTFELHGYPTDYSSGTYKKVAVNGTISGIPGYTYNNVIIELDFDFSWSYGEGYGYHSGTHTATATTELNLAGNGTISIEETARQSGNISVYMKNCSCDGYRIVSVSGTVTQN